MVEIKSSDRAESGYVRGHDCDVVAGHAVLFPEGDRFLYHILAACLKVTLLVVGDHDVHHVLVCHVLPDSVRGCGDEAVRGFNV